VETACSISVFSFSLFPFPILAPRCATPPRNIGISRCHCSFNGTTSIPRQFSKPHVFSSILSFSAHAGAEGGVFLVLGGGLGLCGGGGFFGWFFVFFFFFEGGCWQWWGVFCWWVGFSDCVSRVSGFPSTFSPASVHFSPGSLPFERRRKSIWLRSGDADLAKTFRCNT